MIKMTRVVARPTILLVDNDPIFLDLTSEFLESEGYRVITARSRADALHQAASEIVALAVIDYRLTNDDDDGDQSGLHLASDLKIPVIILTRFHEWTYARNALVPRQRGKPLAVEYVIKQHGYMVLADAISRVLGNTRAFLSYTRQDRQFVEGLYDELLAAGVTPWMDIRDIIGGENWEIAIRHAIESSDFFILCLSNRSVNRRGFIQREIRMALDILDEMLDEDIYLIPVRLEECSVIHSRLAELQWIDLFRIDGVHQLLHAIRTGTSRRE